MRAAVGGRPFRSGEDEVRSAVSNGVTARQDELRDVKRVFEARSSGSVLSAPSPHKKKVKRRKGKKDEDDDELLDSAMTTTFEGGGGPASPN